MALLIHTSTADPLAWKQFSICFWSGVTESVFLIAGRDCLRLKGKEGFEYLPKKLKEESSRVQLQFI